MRIDDVFIETGSTCLNKNILSQSIERNVLDNIELKSGVRARQVCIGSEDSFQLARELISKHSLEEELAHADLIVVVSENVKNIIPPPSSFILKKFIQINSMIIDLNRGCSGYVEALAICDTYFLSKKIKKACIICADNYSHYIHKENRSMSPIFGDAASITILSDNNDYILEEHSSSYPSYKDDLAYNSQDGITMNGANIVHFIKTHVFKSIDNLLSHQPLESIDYFIVHQGSKFVIDAFIDKYELQTDQCPFVISSTGNLNSSSIPLVIKELGHKNLQGKKCLLSAFGVGLSYSNIILNL